MMRLSGSVKLSCARLFGHPELALVAPAPGLVVGVAPARGLGLALALLQARSDLGDGRQPRLAPLDLCGDVQLGLVLLGLIGMLPTLEQDLDLRPGRPRP